MQWPRLLAYITGRVDKELLVRSEYLAGENRIRRANSKGRLQLSEGEKRSLAENRPPADTHLESDLCLGERFLLARATLRHRLFYSHVVCPSRPLIENALRRAALRR